MKALSQYLGEKENQENTMEKSIKFTNAKFILKKNQTDA